MGNVVVESHIWSGCMCTNGVRYVCVHGVCAMQCVCVCVMCVRVCGVCVCMV